jgi:hypothetical protein
VVAAATAAVSVPCAGVDQRRHGYDRTADVGTTTATTTTTTTTTIATAAPEVSAAATSVVLPLPQMLLRVSTAVDLLALYLESHDRTPPMHVDDEAP